MKTYNVYIEEKLCKGISIDAVSIDDAIERVKEMYRNSEIVLTAEDMGTAPEIMASAEDESECTEWSEL